MPTIDARKKQLTQLAALGSLSESFDEVPSKKKYRNLKLTAVVPRSQVRKTFVGLEELAQSLREEGQQTPILVEQKNAEGKYVIIQGERRWRAAQIAGMKRIEAIVVEKPIEETDRKIGQLTENMQRDDMKPLEIAAAIKELMDTGLRITDIGRRLGKSRPYIALYADLIDIPEVLSKFLEKVTVNDATTLTTLKKICVGFPEDAEELLASLVDDDGAVSRAAAKALYKHLQTPRSVDAGMTAEAVPTKPADSTAEAEAEKGVGAASSASAGKDAEDSSSDEGEEAEDGEKPKRPYTKRKRAEPANGGQDEAAVRTYVSRIPLMPVPEGAVQVPSGEALHIAVVWIGMDDDGNVLSRAGYLTPNIYSPDPTMSCITVDHHVYLVPNDEITIDRIVPASDVATEEL